MIFTRHIRIAVQWAMFGLWAFLIVQTRHPIDHWITKWIPVSVFLRMDPLVTTVVCGGMRLAVQITFLGLLTLAVSLIMGRVFCGWVCPLGAVFDFFGWFLRKLRVPFEGPSPKWFTLKYYLLTVMLIFAGLGTVSPLMGLDPIVLLTRTAAVVFYPFGRQSSDVLWTVSSPVGAYGWFIDVATLAIFAGILFATTRLSRIWCRTVCPLGAYLAVVSRHALLRRDTKGCVQCGLCSQHCPTGAIDFKNAEIYNESECIKCFSCTQECPVDANFFTWKNPGPAITKSQHPVSLDRRILLGTAATAMVAAPALRLAAGEPQSQKTMIRPPMSREERDFLTSCIRCAECMKACPTGVLKPAGLEFGLRALWTPVMVTAEAHCQEGCQACSQACPTDAIMKYPLDQKYAFKSGTAVFNSTHCISFTENKFCSECVRVCPTNAIEIEKGWTPPGLKSAQGVDLPAPAGQTPTRPTRVSYDRCVGCGACEVECNKVVFGEAAMITTSAGRAMPTKGLVSIATAVVATAAFLGWSQSAEAQIERVRRESNVRPAQQVSRPTTAPVARPVARPVAPRNIVRPTVTSQPPPVAPPAPVPPPPSSSQPVDLGALNATTVAPPPVAPHGRPVRVSTVPMWKTYFDLWLYSRPGINTLTFDNIHGMLFFEITPTPELQFNCDLGMSGAGAAPRFFELTYQWSPKIQTRIGKILIPFDDLIPHNIFGGRINVSRLLPTGATDQLLPDIWADLGVALKIQWIDSMALSMVTHVYAVNGFGDGGSNPDPGGGGGTEYPLFSSAQSQDNNVDKALGARVQLTFARRLSLGGSVYTGQWSDADSGTARRLLFYGFDGQLRLGAVEFRAGWVGMTVNLTDVSYLRGGLYGEAGVKFGPGQKWKLLGRGGLVQLDNRVIAVTDQTIVGGTILYRPGMVQISAEYSLDLNRSVPKANSSFAALRVATEL